MAVRFHLEMPIAHGCGDRGPTLALLRAAEDAGYDGVAYTDHPAPSRKWLESGGHATYDPFSALAFCAAATERVRLLTYLAVLPYRNPLLLAKSVASVDRLSGGRLTLVVGSGYLRSEFSALGRSFDERNALVDEALGVLTGMWREPAFSHEGSDFTARGVACEPGPVQLPHPPIWVGGNSRLSRERAARHGAGWAPLFASGVFAQTVRTAAIATIDELVGGIQDLRERAAAVGRDPAELGVQVDLGDLGELIDRPDAFAERVAELGGIGVTDVVVRPGRDADPATTTDLLNGSAPVLEHVRGR